MYRKCRGNTHAVQSKRLNLVNLCVSNKLHLLRIHFGVIIVYHILSWWDWHWSRLHLRPFPRQSSWTSCRSSAAPRPWETSVLSVCVLHKGKRSVLGLDDDKLLGPPFLFLTWVSVGRPRCCQSFRWSERRGVGRELISWTEALPGF